MIASSERVRSSVSSRSCHRSELARVCSELRVCPLDARTRLLRRSVSLLLVPASARARVHSVAPPLVPTSTRACPLTSAPLRCRSCPLPFGCSCSPAGHDSAPEALGTGVSLLLGMDEGLLGLLASRTARCWSTRLLLTAIARLGAVGLALMETAGRKRTRVYTCDMPGATG